MSTLYNADIIEAATRGGNFKAALRGSPITATGPDPEHELCFAMVEAGLPDGEIQFYRGPTPSLRYKSVHRTARYRVGMGEAFPHALFKRRKVSPEDRARMASKPGALATQNRETPLAGTSGHPILQAVPESPRTVCEVAL